MGILSDQQQHQPTSSRSRSPHVQQQHHHHSDAFFPPSSASSTTSSHGNHTSSPHSHGSHPFAAGGRRPGSPGMAFPREVNGQGHEINTDDGHDGHSQATGSTSHHGTSNDHPENVTSNVDHSHSHTHVDEPKGETSVRKTMSQTAQRQELARMDMVAGKKVECGGCSKLIDQASGGIVVAFGKSLWHVDCFRCVKCNNRVTADTNLLLLSDGDPVCSSCSYQCYVCKLPITEEAIMTGDESYHADCFTCRQCSRRIEELVFAKTSQGIYCMTCHNERVARSRRHAEAKQRARAKKEREKEKDKEKERVRGAGERPAPIISNSSATERSRADSAGGSQPSKSPRPEALSGISALSTPAGLTPSPSRHGFIGIPEPGGASSASETIQLGSPRLDSDFRREDPSRQGSSLDRHRHSPSPMSNSRRKLSPGVEIDMSYYSGGESGQGSASTVDPERPNSRNRNQPGGLNHQSSSEIPIGLGVGPVGGLSTLTTSRADKRGSINPEMVLNYQQQQYKEEVQSASSSAPNSSKDYFSGRSSPSPVMDSFSAGRHSPLPNSPLRASFTDAEARENERAGARSATHTGSPTLKSYPASSSRLTPTVPVYGGPKPRSPMIRAASDTGQASDTPPRSSSLTDSLDTVAAKGTNRREEDRDDVTIKEKTLYQRGPTQENNSNKGLPSQPSNSYEPPRIDAPAWSNLGFSLSDPDFAKLLAEVKASPEKAKQAFAAREASPGRSRLQTAAGERVTPLQKPTKAPGSNSLPASPVLGHSPPLQTIMAAYASDASKNTERPQRSDSLRSLNNGLVSDEAGQRRQPTLAVHRQSSEELVTDLSELKIPTLETTVPALQALLASTATATSLDGSVSIQKTLLERAVNEIQALTDQVTVLKDKYSGARRTSLHYMEGMTVASEEYEKAVQARLEAETEVARLKAEVHGQTARLSLIAEDERRQESLKRQSSDLVTNLSGLEQDVSKLRVERDITLAEVQELAATKTDSDLPNVDPVEKGATVARSLTKRLNTVKEQYKTQLQPLTLEHERLSREIAELRGTRDLYLEEAAALSAKNDELAELNTRLTKQTESMQDGLARPRAPSAYMRPGVKHHISGSPSLSSIATSATLHEMPDENFRQIRNGRADPIDAAPAARRFKWYKSSKGPEPSGLSNSISRPLALPPDKNKTRPSNDPGVREHVFQPTSILRFSKCEHCGDKMWGLQEVRCAVCGVYCHTKCVDKLGGSCSGSHSGHIREEPSVETVTVTGPSLFGRDLTEQVQEDGQPVPIIVTKCIEAVETQGMEYEGIYRKTGGSSLSKAITQLFEKGNYDSFDLNDIDRFNDINSITSVLKSYFRALPNPLLTHGLHELFVTAASIREPDSKFEALSALLTQLPAEHYNTLRTLMLHLHRVKSSSAENLMNARNLGVVFGPTLMRSADPSREFADMAGKALSIEWMIENAPAVFL